ncbi:hypothetical protein T07_376, partial [Trichinella nelsoni]
LLNVLKSNCTAGIVYEKMYANFYSTAIQTQEWKMDVNDKKTACETQEWKMDVNDKKTACDVNNEEKKKYERGRHEAERGQYGVEQKKTAGACVNDKFTLLSFELVRKRQMRGYWLKVAKRAK